MNIPYFMDEMQLYEIDDILECLPYLDRNSWEQCRLNSYITSMIDHSKVKMSDFLEFPWEAEDKKERQKITDKDIEYLKQLEKLWSDKPNE